MVKKKGQSTVEYLLVMAIVFITFFKVFQSDAFRNLFAGDSDVMKGYRKYIEFSYRHGYLDLGFKTITEPFSDYTNNQHPSYTNPESGNDTRFFLVSEPYGE